MVGISDQSHIPVRQFTYLPLMPRLIRLFGNANITQVLQSHATMKNLTHNFYDLHESLGWKSAYSIDGVFQNDPRGVSLALC